VAPQDNSDRSVRELVQQLSNQTAALVRKEIRLAQLELQEKGKRAGLGAGMFGGSGLVALYGLGAHPVLLFHYSVVLNPRETYIREVVPRIQGMPNPFYDYYTRRAGGDGEG
jgi:hypothetical protein